MTCHAMHNALDPYLWFFTPYVAAKHLAATYWACKGVSQLMQQLC